MGIERAKDWDQQKIGAKSRWAIAGIKRQQILFAWALSASCFLLACGPLFNSSGNDDEMTDGENDPNGQMMPGADVCAAVSKEIVLTAKGGNVYDGKIVETLSDLTCDDLKANFACFDHVQSLSRANGSGDDCSGYISVYHLDFPDDYRLDVRFQRVSGDIRWSIRSGLCEADHRYYNGICNQASSGEPSSANGAVARYTAGRRYLVIGSSTKNAQYEFTVALKSYAGASSTEDSNAACSDNLDNDDDGHVDCDDFECKGTGITACE